jgi:hypothetical protein
MLPLQVLLSSTSHIDKDFPYNFLWPLFGSGLLTSTGKETDQYSATFSKVIESDSASVNKVIETQYATVGKVIITHSATFSNVIQPHSAIFNNLSTLNTRYCIDHLSCTHQILVNLTHAKELKNINLIRILLFLHS